MPIRGKYVQVPLQKRVARNAKRNRTSQKLKNEPRDKTQLRWASRTKKVNSSNPIEKAKTVVRLCNGRHKKWKSDPAGFPS